MHAPRIDLHTHSTASDGTLSPAALVRAAAQAGVEMLALTDHDTTEGLPDALTAAGAHGVRLIPGIEMSATWQGRDIHVTGLDIDPDDPRLRGALARLRESRARRAQEMGRRLAGVGFPDALPAARRLAGGASVTRTHFARALVEQGYFDGVPAVFRRFLVPGKPGHVPTRWPDLEEVVGWIRGAGGAAAVAHLMRYRLTGTRRRRLLADFRAAGGDAMEVVCGNYSAIQMRDSANYAARYGLRGAVGSDFHGPEQTWLRFGRLPALPGGLRPVWERW